MRRALPPLLALLLAGCAAGDDGADEPGAVPAPPASGAGTPTSAESLPGDCEEVPTELLATIESGGENATGFTVTRGAAYRSGPVWLVAAEFTATGVDAQRGVWATQDLTGEDVTAVDPVAQQFTVWPEDGGADAEAPADTDVEEALACLR